ncbi:hypothetical protein DAI22_07g079000 [Oryza sativa Japonica Group]|nr:hypothetical protein DAI22_07g079000 [Oryza sativa Japonica Group]
MRKCSCDNRPNTVVDEVVKIVWKEQNMKSIALQKTRSITAVLPNKSVVLQSARSITVEFENLSEN